MPDCREHCVDHENRTKLLIENAACIAAMKREREHQFVSMRDEANVMHSEIAKLKDGKVDSGMFKWIMSAVGAVAVMILITLMAQASTMSDIKADVRVMKAELEK